MSDLTRRGNILYGPDGAPIANMSRKKIKIGMRIATKGNVMCWNAKGSIVSNTHEVGHIQGTGEITDGPDYLDRYTVLIKGAKVLIHVDSFVAHF